MAASNFERNPRFPNDRIVPSAAVRFEQYRTHGKRETTTNESSSNSKYERVLLEQRHTLTSFSRSQSAKKDLDRQRPKGNSTKISQLENQIRQYEQQLNEIKRRLDAIEVEHQ